MTRIENEAEYEWAVNRVEQLLSIVGEDTPASDPAYIELNLLTNLVADYSEEHYAIGDLSPVDL